MENKINIAELLKDCPQGMELDCTMYEDSKLLDVDKNANNYVIRIATPCGVKYLDKYGCYTADKKAKCVIFPKGNTTWEGFVPPCEFKDGDVIYVSTKLFKWVSILKEDTGDGIATYADYCLSNRRFYGINDDSRVLCQNNRICEKRIATKEEKEKLLQAIKDNGYKWNAETKTLDKLDEPRFKVGDKIVKRNSITNPWIVNSVSSEYYGLKLHKDSEAIGVLTVSEQDDWDLVPDKFEISSLKPFDKVLTRANDEDTWVCNLYSHRMTDYHVILNAELAVQCIPYEGNELLLGTNYDCDEFYKTWE